jgi:hypothetical protein
MYLNEYLNSPEWFKIRDMVIKRDGNKCQHCEAKKNLKVHHLEYPGVIFQEMDHLDKIITLCKDCHDKEHSDKVERKGIEKEYLNQLQNFESPVARTVLEQKIEYLKEEIKKKTTHKIVIKVSPFDVNILVYDYENIENIQVINKQIISLFEKSDLVQELTLYIENGKSNEIKFVVRDINNKQ